MTYNFDLHAHRFAVWTAARAVARNFINTKGIQKSIEESNLSQRLEKLVKDGILNSDSFDSFHSTASNRILNSLEQSLGQNSHKATYGRAAKIIAIYIKTRYILVDPASLLSKVAHPPIDSILLKNLPIAYQHLNPEKISWTKLDEESYFTLINKIRDIQNFDFFWKLEEYWMPK